MLVELRGNILKLSSFLTVFFDSLKMMKKETF